MRNDFDERDGMNAIQRERMERRAATRRKSMVTTAVFVIVGIAVIAGIIIAISALVGGGKKNDNQEPTAVTATIATEAPKAETTKPTENSQTATQSDQQATQAQQNQQDPAAPAGQSSTDAPIQNSTDAPISSSSPSSDGSSSADGNVLHYYANGQTSYGYDWTYSGGGGIVAINCGYNFDNNQYDFSITGISPGTTSITLYYNTDDGVQQPVYMTVNVDDNLNVTQIG